MRAKDFVFMPFMALLLTSGCVSITWSTTVNGILTAKSVLPTTNGMGNQLIEGVSAGAQLAMVHCRNAFKWDRWNCPESAFSRKLADFVTREHAYAGAILSAAIVHELTKRCAHGEIPGCGCDVTVNALPTTSKPTAHHRNLRLRTDRAKATQHTPHESAIGSQMAALQADEKMAETVEWRWGGCSEDVGLGERVAQKLLDALDGRRDAQAYARLHNNRAGRLAVRKSMQKRCKCHGISGSCSMQVCWKQMASFSQIADVLKQRYKKSISFNYDKKFGNAVHVKRESDEDGYKENPDTLVFVENSPNYCVSNSKIDWTGTTGRACSRQRGEKTTVSEKKSCRNICRSCGHKVKKQKRQIVEHCHCSFHWCCEVKCEKCTRTIEEHYCV